MSEKSNFTEEDFRKFQENIKNLGQDEKSKVVSELIVSLFPKFYQFIHSIPHGNMRTTSIANSVVLRLLENCDKTLESIEKADFLDAYLKYLWKAIKWHILTRVKKNAKNPIQIPIDEESGKEIEFPDVYKNDDFGQCVGQEILNLLDKLLFNLKNDNKKRNVKIDKDIFMMVLGFDVPDEEKNESSVIPASKLKLNYKSIAEYLNKKYATNKIFTEDSVRMRYKRLIERIKEMDELNQFKDEYQE